MYGGTISQIGNTSIIGHTSMGGYPPGGGNEWIRTCGKFDGVIDSFDAVLADPANPLRLNPDYNFDGLHP